MGLAILDLMWRIEREFGVKIGHDQYSKMVYSNDPPDIKVGQLFDFVRALVPHSGVLDSDLDADVLWPLFQLQFVNTLGVKVSEVTKDKGLIRDLGGG